MSQTPFRVGLTGGIASGKSAVATVLARHGAVVIDSDVLAREAVARGSSGLQAVVDRFGDSLLTSEGDLDRAALGAIVFRDAAARKDLEAIVHPRVRARAAEIENDAAHDHRIVVQMIPLLVETGQAANFDVLVVVDVPAWMQRERLRVRDGMDEAQAQRRLDAQASRGARLAVADVVIDNSTDLADLSAIVGSVWSLLVRRATSDPAIGDTCDAP